MKIAIRVDGSEKLGSGHIMRCLNLSEGLEKKGYKISFISSSLNKPLSSLIEKQNYSLFRINSTTPDLDASETLELIKSHSLTGLVVDHYGLDFQWERKIATFVDKIAVLDDLANRRHDCGFLLDQNLGLPTKYEGLVPSRCKVVQGPQFALLRPEFYLSRKKVQRNRPIKQVLVSFGGSDPTNEVSKCLRAIEILDNKILKFNVVTGPMNSAALSINEMAENMKQDGFDIHMIEKTENMAQLMLDADLALGAGGTTTWERCLMMLPSILISVADNQTNVLKYLNETGACIYLGSHKNVFPENIAQSLNTLINTLTLRQDLIKQMQTVISLNGDTKESPAIDLIHDFFNK